MQSIQSVFDIGYTIDVLKAMREKHRRIERKGKGMTKADAHVLLFDDVSAYMRSLYGDGTTGKLVSNIAKNVLNDGQLDDGTNDLASTVIAKPMRALFDRNKSKELILVFLKLIGATTRGLQAQGKDIIYFARALGKRYGFPNE